MKTKHTSFFHPNELQSNTSVLTVLAYVISGLIRIFEWPSVMWYGVMALSTVNILLIGKLIYDLKTKAGDTPSKGKIWAGVRLLINLVLMLVAWYYFRLGYE